MPTPATPPRPWLRLHVPQRETCIRAACTRRPRGTAKVPPLPLAVPPDATCGATRLQRPGRRTLLRASSIFPRRSPLRWDERGGRRRQTRLPSRVVPARGGVRGGLAPCNSLVSSCRQCRSGPCVRAVQVAVRAREPSLSCCARAVRVLCRGRTLPSPVRGRAAAAAAAAASREPAMQRVPVDMPTAPCSGSMDTAPARLDGARRCIRRRRDARRFTADDAATHVSEPASTVRERCHGTRAPRHLSVAALGSWRVRRAMWQTLSDVDASALPSAACARPRGALPPMAREPTQRRGRAPAPCRCEARFQPRRAPHLGGGQTPFGMPCRAAPLRESPHRRRRRAGGARRRREDMAWPGSRLLPDL